MKEKDPISNVRFWCKDDPSKAITIRKDQVGAETPSRVPRGFHNQPVSEQVVLFPPRCPSSSQRPSVNS